MRNLLLFSLLFLVSVVSACGGSGSNVRQSLGLTKKAPDEFMVLSRPKLTVPPDFELNPPSEVGLTRRSDIPDQARAALISEGKSEISASDAESALLSRAGKGDPEIRKTLDKETLARIEEDNVIDEIRGANKDPIVDAKKEKERIAEKEQKGEKITGDKSATRNQPRNSVVKEILN